MRLAPEELTILRDSLCGRRMASWVPVYCCRPWRHTGHHMHSSATCVWCGGRVELNGEGVRAPVAMEDDTWHSGCADTVQREWLGAEPSVVIEEGAA